MGGPEAMFLSTHYTVLVQSQDSATHAFNSSSRTRAPDPSAWERPTQLLHTPCCFAEFLGQLPWVLLAALVPGCVQHTTAALSAGAARLPSADNFQKQQIYLNVTAYISTNQSEMSYTLSYNVKMLNPVHKILYVYFI